MFYGRQPTPVVFYIIVYLKRLLQLKYTHNITSSAFLKNWFHSIYITLTHFNHVSNIVIFYKSRLNVVEYIDQELE